MATDIENLIALRAATIAELRAIGDSAETAGGLPNAPGSVDHTGYERKLWDRLESLNKQIAAADGAYEVTSEMSA
jgi:hypothetical protein